MNLVILIVSLLGIGMWFTPIFSNGWSNMNIITYIRSSFESDTVNMIIAAKVITFFGLVVAVLILVYMVMMGKQAVKAIGYIREKEENEEFILKSIKWTASFYGIIMFCMGMAFYLKSRIVKNGVAIIVQTVAIIAMMIIYAVKKRGNNEGDTRNFIRQIVASTISIIAVYIFTYPLAKSDMGGITNGGMLGAGLDGRIFSAILVVLLSIFILITNCIHIGTCVRSINKGYDIANNTRNAGIINLLLSLGIILIITLNKRFVGTSIGVVPILVAVFGLTEIII